MPIVGTVRPQCELTLADSSGNAELSARVALGVPQFQIPADADGLFDVRATLAASASVEHDLRGGLLDPLGGAVVFTKVYVLAVYADPGNTNNVEVGGAAGGAWVFAKADDDVVVLQPGGSLLLTSPTGIPTVATTGDLLKIANSGAGTSVTYRLVILGVAA